MDIKKDIDQFIAEFRSRFATNYADTNDWPDDVVARALYKAYPAIGRRWGVMDITDPINLAAEGLFLWAAHWLFVNFQYSATNISPNLTPEARMNVATKSIGDESVSFRITRIQDAEDDWLSLSNFGVEFLDLRSRVSMGGFAVGEGFVC